MEEGWLHAFFILVLGAREEIVSLPVYCTLRKIFIYAQMLFSDSVCKCAQYVSLNPRNLA
jgi:hypothetical protein